MKPFIINVMTTRKIPLSVKGIKAVGLMISRLEYAKLSAKEKKRIAYKREINIRITTDREIKKINRDYLGHERATDVIAFSYIEDGFMRGPSCRDSRDVSAGDIMVSLDMARKKCGEFGNSCRKELLLYIIHGMLHVFGHDDTHPESRKRMMELQDKYFEKHLRPI
jgi:rRNA maturation RNase YbeY